ncbi:MAG: alpha/beta hydrolase [Deltaproteobacteria bacterium]|nr:alpha/beta hydrolase [Deltaproteobacteria bacterium]
MAALSHETIRSNGLKLHVVQAGPADGPLALLLHGFPEGWWGMRRQIDPLVAAGYRVMVPDQRGYGSSARPTAVRDYRLDALTTDMIGLIDAAGRDKAFVVGHDWGAAVAWWMAVLHPDRLEKLVAMNVPHPVVMRRTLRTSRTQLTRSWYALAFQIPFLADTGIAHTHILEDLIRRSARSGTFSEEDFAIYRDGWSQPGALTAMIAWYRAAFRHPPRPPDSERVRVPTHLVWGAKDNFVGVEMAEPSLALCDSGRLTLFPEATHWVHHEEAEAIGKLIVEFFGARPSDEVSVRASS